MMLQFHWYGFFIGLAVVIGWIAIEYQAKKNSVNTRQLEQAAWWVLGGGLLGARAWHVGTDWFLYYPDRLLQIFAISNGGLSILGAVAGGIIGLYIWSLVSQSSLKIPVLLDLSVFGLPLGQAFGRLGNFFNQELYGYPTQLPWGIFIEPHKRLPEFSNAEYFHPLFAYEAGMLLFFWLLLWPIVQKKKHSFITIGTGQLFLGYILFYSVLRVGLDFLRPGKTEVLSGLGLNQAILLIVVLLCSGLFIHLYAARKTLVKE